jgi:hypothetical protein
MLTFVKKLRRETLMRSAYCLIISACLFFSGSVAAGALSFFTNTYVVAENVTTHTITVSRTGLTLAGASVTVTSTNGTATAGADFTAVSQVLTWGVGDGADKTFTITISDDTIVEGTEIFTLKFSSAVGDGTAGDATVAITDYEEGKLQLSAAYFTGQEDSSEVIATINRISGTKGAASVKLKSSAGVPPASNTLDYTDIDVTVPFADGESTKNVSITLKNDDIAEFSEWFKLTLSAPTNASLGPIITANVEVKDTDVDFTSTITLLAKNIANLNIEQPRLIDLKQNSLLDTQKKILDLVNAIPILFLTDITVDQDAEGFLTIDVETDRFYLRPVAVKKAAVGAIPMINLRDDSSAEFITSQGWFLEAQPALSQKGISVFQKALAELSLPGLVITENGNITVQQDQGSPPFERDDFNNVVVNYSFYDRYNFRPSMISTVTTATKEGYSLIQHPVDGEEMEVSIIYNDGASYRQQILSSAPINGPELLQQLSSKGIGICAVTSVPCIAIQNTINISNPRQLSGGIVSFDVPGVRTIKFTLFADYKIRKVPDFIPGMVGFTQIADLNKDTYADYRMVYANGEEQYFFLVSVYVSP